MKKQILEIFLLISIVFINLLLPPLIKAEEYNIPIPARFTTPQFKEIFKNVSQYMRELKNSEAAEECKKVIQKYPNDDDALIVAYTILADAKFAEKKYDEAIQASQEVIKKIPLDDESYRYYLASARLSIGAANYYLGKHNQAIDIFRDVIEKYPDPIGDYDAPGLALFNMVKFFREKNEYSQIVPLLEDLLRKYPKKKIGCQALYELAVYYKTQKNYSQAIQKYQQLIDTYPNSNLANVAKKNIELLTVHIQKPK